MEELIDLHIYFDSKTKRMGQQFITENEDVKLEYRKYLESKYKKYSKEFDILNDLLVINPIIKINNFMINDEIDFEEQEFIFNINNKINVKMSDYGKINIEIQGVKKFHIEFAEYNMKDKKKFPVVKIKKSNPSAFEAEDTISYVLNKKIEEDLNSNLKNFLTKMIKIKSCIQKEYTTSNNISYVFEKDLLNMSSEDIEFSMLANDYQIKPFLDDIKNIFASNPIIKQSKKIK